MELHHKLRRDPNWHPNACNICGQLGHQAAQCTTGTINWKQIYGEDSFILKPPIYSSEYDALTKKKAVDVGDLEKRAREYAKMRSQSMGIDYNDMTKRAQEMLGQVQEGNAARAAAGNSDNAEGSEAPPAAAAAAGAPLPEGWSSTIDAQGRTYYWHTKTKKTQWDRPTADTPIQ